MGVCVCRVDTVRLGVRGRDDDTIQYAHVMGDDLDGWIGPRSG